MKPSFVRRMAVPAVCLLAVAVVTGLLAFWTAARQLALLDGFCTTLVARAPETADAVYALVKDGTFAGQASPGVLAALGYRPRDFAAGTGWLFAVAGAALALGITLLGGTFFLSRRAFARYLSLGMTPRELRSLFWMEGAVLALRPLVITLPLTAGMVALMLQASYLDPALFLAEAPVLPVVLFALGILFFVALAYALGARRVLSGDLAGLLKDDSLL